jgi:hypothetical protein
MVKGFYQTIAVNIVPGLVGRFISSNPNNDGKQPVNASNIATWVDVSGGKVSPTQGTAVNQPVFNTNVSGGQPGITFNSDAGGANGDSLKTTVSTYLSRLNLANGSTGFTIYICAKIVALTPPSTQSGCMLFMQGSSPSINEIYQISHYPSGGINCSVIGSNSVQSSMIAGYATANTPFITSFWWDKSAATIYSQFNSNSIVTGPNAGTLAALNTGPTLFAIGQQKNSFPNRQFDGTIFEILIYNVLHTAKQRLDITRYLGNQFGVSI